MPLAVWLLYLHLEPPPGVTAGAGRHLAWVKGGFLGTFGKSDFASSCLFKTRVNSLGGGGGGDGVGMFLRTCITA